MFQKLSAIPLSAFCSSETKRQFEKYIRFCFIKVNVCLGKTSKNQFSTEVCKRLVVTFCPQSPELDCSRNRNLAGVKFSTELLQLSAEEL